VEKINRLLPEAKVVTVAQIAASQININRMMSNLSLMFLVIILGATDRRAPAGFAPIAIGLGLTLIHLISIPVTNTSVNPARSTGPALMAGDWALGQLWLFWVAPLLGALVAGYLYRWLGAEK
jgi:aquaporin Z